jgi:8-amino-7-oxononanoate synthase
MSDKRNGSSTDVETPAPPARLTASRPDPEPVTSEAPPAAPGAMEYDYTNFYFGAGEDAFALLAPFDDWWREVKPAGYYLYELPLRTAPSTTVDVEDTKTHEVRSGLVNFASYNYLGLSYRPEVKEAIKAAVDQYGGGASGSPILSGTTQLHRLLAEEIADFKKKEAALIFPTGYSANVGTIAGLMRSGDLVVADQYAHASIVDGMILSKATSRFFRHNKVEDLDRKLSGFEGKKLVIIEGVYSMDGDTPPLADIVEVCRKHGARLMIDEAHSAFVYGANGRGVVEDQGMEDEVDIHLGTFSKSLGGQGGYIAGTHQLVNYLRGFSRSRFFSCALSPAVVAGLRKALELARNEPELRTRLWDNVATMQGLLADGGVPIGDSTSQVIPIMVRDDARIFQIGEEIFREGVFINPVKYPAVGKHKSRFRMSISAAHSKEELEKGAEVIIRVLRRYGICQ